MKTQREGRMKFPYKWLGLPNTLFRGSGVQQKSYRERPVQSKDMKTKNIKEEGLQTSDNVLMIRRDKRNS